MPTVANSLNTVLVIEDEEALIKAIKKKLEVNNYNAIVAKEVDEAIFKLNKHNNIGAIWLDHTLVGENNGLDFLTYLKESKRLSDIPIFVITNSDDPENLQKYIRFGVTRHYIKSNFKLEDIIQDLKEYQSAINKSDMDKLIPSLSNTQLHSLFLNFRYDSGTPSCIYCNCENLHSIDLGNRYKCKNCKKKFRDWNKTLLGSCRLSERTIYNLTWCFAAGLSTLNASKVIGTSYQTVFNFYNLIRCSQCKYFSRCGRCLAKDLNEEFAYEISEKNGQIVLEVIPIIDEPFNIKKGGSLIYQGCFHCNAEKDSISPEIKNFLAYGESFLNRYKGYLHEHTQLYLREMCWRYNNRNATLVEQVNMILSALLRSIDN